FDWPGYARLSTTGQPNGRPEFPRNCTQIESGPAICYNPAVAKRASQVDRIRLRRPNPDNRPDQTTGGSSMRARLLLCAFTLGICIGMAGCHSNQPVYNAPPMGKTNASQAQIAQVY